MHWLRIGFQIQKFDFLILLSHFAMQLWFSIRVNKFYQILLPASYIYIYPSTYHPVSEVKEQNEQKKRNVPEYAYCNMRCAAYTHYNIHTHGAL